ncbi:MAG: LysR family transcriptional regulator [Planctomycetota bacterium]
MSPSIEIRHLRYFLAVARTENFTRAAEQLHVTQPNVSQQMKDLEKLLGTPLFQRLGKRIRLTNAGVAFQKNAEVVLRKLDEARDSVRDVADRLTGHVEVGVIPALSLAWVPPALGALARDFPGLTVSVHQRPSREIEIEVETGRFDLGLGIVSHTSPNLRYRRMLTERLALIVAADHALARRRRLAVRDLERVPLVVLQHVFDMRGLVDEMLRTAKVRGRVAFEIGTIDSTLQTVLAAGIPTILPPIVLKGRESFGLRAIQLAGRVEPIEFGFLTPRENEPSPAARKFIEYVEAAIAKPARARK